MRSRASANGISVVLVAGTGVIQIAIDIEDALREGLLGFAIWKREPGSSGFVPLKGGRIFADGDPTEAVGAPLDKAPRQDFPWGDYEVDAGDEYTYRIAPVTGSPGALVARDGVDVSARTESEKGSTNEVYLVVS